MSNNTFNFNAPVHVHMESEANAEALLEIMEKLCDLEVLMFALIDTLYDDMDDLDDEDDEDGEDGEDGEDAEEDGEVETRAPAEDEIPMILCLAKDLDEDLSPEEASVIAKEALSHILNFKPCKEDHHGRA